jgi:NADP-reducing hydrogenase subunit HndD
VHYDFVEVMACPGGCIGGGGQPKTKDPATIPRRLGAIYGIDEGAGIRMSHQNPDVLQLYDEALGQPGGQRAHELLHTHYSDKSKDVV